MKIVKVTADRVWLEPHQGELLENRGSYRIITSTGIDIRVEVLFEGESEGRNVIVCGAWVPSWWDWRTRVMLNRAIEYHEPTVSDQLPNVHNPSRWYWIGVYV